MYILLIESSKFYSKLSMIPLKLLLYTNADTWTSNSLILSYGMQW